MLAIATVGGIMTMPGQTAGVSLFSPSFEEALNLSRTQQTGAYAMGTFLASLAMTYVGAQMDRFGIKRVIGIVCVLFGLVCVYTGFVSGFWTLFIAFLFLRMFGQGALSLLSSNTAAMWFDKQLGFANGVMGVGFSLASAGAPLFIFWLISSFGWRWTYPILGGIVVAVMLPLIIFFYVNRPEELGQKLDGEVDDNEPDSPIDADEPVTLNTGPQFTLQQAMRTPAYWIVAAMMFATSMIGTAIIFNSLFLFAEFGLTEAQTVAVLATGGLAGAIAQLPAGWLADHVKLRWLVVASMVGQCGLLILLLFVTSVEIATTYAILNGVLGSLYNGVIGPLWARYFGREHLGKIRGSIFTAQVAGSSLGPFVMGYLFDLTGSYTPSLTLFIIIYAIFVVLTPFARRPSLQDISHA